MDKRYNGKKPHSTVCEKSMHQRDRVQIKAIAISIKYPFIISTCLFIIPFFLLTCFLHRGFLKWGDYIIGLSTFFLGITTIYLALTGMSESARARMISSYPLLSQKIETKDVPNTGLSKGLDTQHYERHFRILIKNYGKGPAINQDRVYYKFFNEGKEIKYHIPITGAHDIIEPLVERPLNMTKLSRDLGRDDWYSDLEEKFYTIWVRLPHLDIQRNECCNCTKYEHRPKLEGRFGKMERYWYFAGYPEISSEKCRKCEWRA